MLHILRLVGSIGSCRMLHILRLVGSLQYTRYLVPGIYMCLVMHVESCEEDIAYRVHTPYEVWKRRHSLTLLHVGFSLATFFVFSRAERFSSASCTSHKFCSTAFCFRDPCSFFPPFSFTYRSRFLVFFPFLFVDVFLVFSFFSAFCP